MPFKGDLKSLSLSTVMQILSSEHKTGTLEIVRGGRKSVIYLKEGKIIAASSGQKQLQLGSLLQERGLIGRDRLKEAVARASKANRPLGEVLLALGCIDQERLKETVRQQVRETVLDLFLLEEGNFEYHDRPVQFDPKVFDEIKPMEIMLEAARRMDEWAVIKKIIPSDTMVFKISEEARQQSDKIALETGEWRLASLLDGTRSVREIIKECGTGEFNVYRALYALATSKLIQPVARPAAAKERPGRDDDLARLLALYHDVLVTISRHLQDQLGQEFCGKLFASCKSSLPKENQPVVSPYQPALAGAQNVRQISALVRKLWQEGAGPEVVAGPFNQLVSCLLYQEAEILGARQTLQTIGRIEQLLGVVAEYQGAEGKAWLVSGIRESISRVAAAVA